MKEPKRCPICGSQSWRCVNTYHSGFSLSKGIAGSILFGRRNGKWLGLLGRKTRVYACSDCHLVMEYKR